MSLWSVLLRRSCRYLDRRSAVLETFARRGYSGDPTARSRRFEAGAVGVVLPVGCANTEAVRSSHSITTAPIRDLIRRFGEDPSKLDAQGLRKFVLSQSRSSGWATAKRCTTALRMFLRFLIAEGRCRAGLLGAIPALAHWRLSSLPRYLMPEAVERVIDSCNVSSPVGKRDRAILLLLARLGLRAGDIVQMRLEDIDWKGAWVHVSGKGHRQTRLPLTQEVGDAIVSYVQEGRPRSHTDRLFLRSRAPFRGFRSHPAVSVIVATAFRRAGINRPGRGAAHLLRHSIASSMLRQGASLQELFALLRHRSIETTQIYAKIDVT